MLSSNAPVFNGLNAFFKKKLLNCLSTAESLPEESDEAGDDASVQLGAAAGSVWGPQGWYGQTPVLPWLWTLLQNGEGNLSVDTRHQWAITWLVCFCGLF